MALKVVVMTLLVLLSLAQIPALMSAERTDLKSLLAELDFESAKNVEESCEGCACTRMVPPNYCHCRDPSACPKCVCKQTLPYYGVPLKYCDSLTDRVFMHYCPSRSRDEGTHGYTIV